MVDLTTGGYATPADLTAGEWVDTAPDNAVRLLRSASLRVAEACFRNPYADTPSAEDAPVLRDATCAQATVWITSGIDPSDVGVAEAAVKRSALLTGSVEYDTSTQAKTRTDAVEGLAAEAVAILTAAGLIYMPVPLSGTSWLPSWGLDVPYPLASSPLARAEWPYV